MATPVPDERTALAAALIHAMQGVEALGEAVQSLAELMAADAPPAQDLGAAIERLGAARSRAAAAFADLERRAGGILAGGPPGGPEPRPSGAGRATSDR